MFAYLKRFHNDESGAITVDWVVLTAGLTLFGVAIVMVIFDAAQDPAEGIGAELAAIEIE